MSRKEKKVELTEDQKFILQLSAEVSTYMNIHKAAYFGQAKNIEKLLETKSPADAYDTESGNTPLILASRNGHARAVQVLLEKGRASVNLAGMGGLTALHHACKNDHVEVVSILLEQGKAHVNTEDDAGNTPAALCARMGNLKCLELLAAKGANVDHPSKSGATPLTNAVLNARMAIVDFLMLKKGVNLNHADAQGNTALHVAAQCGFPRVVTQLLAAGAKTTVENEKGERAEDIAVTGAIKNLIKAQTPGAAL